jgi:ribonuclease HII
MFDRPRVCGVDEAGRGPLAGPVYAAAVILDPARPIAGLADSKKLSERKREALFQLIIRESTAWAIGRAEAHEIDELNILQASLLAMRRAVAWLRAEPTQVLVDGNQCPALDYPVRAVVGGDACVAEISAASILAKVARDRDLVRLDRLHPEYGFKQHKGYPTAAHLAALREFGASPAHRRSFAPVAHAILSRNQKGN